MSDDNPTPTIDLNSPEIQAAIAAAADEAVAGLKAKNQELLGKLQTTSSTLKQFEGVDLEKYNQWQQQLSTNETARLIAEGKHEEVIQRQVEPMKQKYESEIAQYKAQLEQRDQLTLQGGLKATVATSGVDPQAVDGVLAMARGMFNSLDENLNPIAKDASGNVIYGEDGKPLTPQAWLAQLRVTNAFYWGQPQGGGSGGGQGNHQTLNPKEMSVQEIKDLRANDPAKYEQLFPKK